MAENCGSLLWSRKKTQLDHKGSCRRILGVFPISQYWIPLTCQDSRHVTGLGSRFSAHAHHMADGEIPKDIFHVELASGKRSVGQFHLQIKFNCKYALKELDMEINTSQLVVWNKERPSCRNETIIIGWRIRITTSISKWRLFTSALDPASSANESGCPVKVDNLKPLSLEV